MPCVPFNDGTSRGFICGPGLKPKRCLCGSGRPATQLCDWKLVDQPGATCSAPTCSVCTHVPAPGKDLCTTHAAEWRARQAKGPRG